jgi:hypothetical protein
MTEAAKAVSSYAMQHFGLIRLVGIGIGMREHVREIAPDLPVVREPDQGGPVTWRPLTDGALVALKPHRMAASTLS